MKTLLWKLVIPLTVISFATFTKWWHIDTNELTDIFTGFPFPYVCSGWHTSLSLQIFITELLLDLIVYFAFWFVLTYAINRYYRIISIPKVASVFLLSISGFIVATTLFWMSITHGDNIFYMKNPYSVKVVETGYWFFGEDFR